MRLITSSILRPSLKQNKTSLRIQHKYAYLPHILNDWNPQELIVLSINKMNSLRGVSASPKRIKNDNIMPCYEARNKNKKFKYPKEPTKYVRNRKRKNLKKGKFHSRPPRQKITVILGHTGKS